MGALRVVGLGFVLVSLAAGCGGRTSVDPPQALDAGVSERSERCNQRDDDRDGRVDEDFRDTLGRYVADEHCGACAQLCEALLPNALGVTCGLVDELPACVPEQCAEGFAPSTHGTCTALGATLCQTCREDADCGTLVGASCELLGSELGCSYRCELGCPDGYVCVRGEVCAPEGGDCACDIGDGRYELACDLAPADAARGCAGRATCDDGVLSACTAPDELCDGEDNDCDGSADEDFLNAQEAYGVDAHCGACGRDCSADDAAGVELTCGGDPFAPSCVTLCPDTLDGLQVGDRVDADRAVQNGCECAVQSQTDPVGVGRNGAQVDDNCDGADGNVLESFYVTTAGDDSGPGSPTRPLRSIDLAIERAHDSLSSERPRRHVYVASGVYTERVVMRDGVLLHGGYRSDFLSLDPDGFEVVVVAPADTDALGGAALVIEAAGARETLVEGMSFRGRDGSAPGELALGIDIIQPSANLTLRNLRVRSGKPAAGDDGVEGTAGVSPARPAGDGQPQRPAVEDLSHACLVTDQNIVRGGLGGVNVCQGVDVSGGNGGSAVCPSFQAATAAGRPGQTAVGVPGGAGGGGSHDLSGPLTMGPSCDQPVCCQGADFRVPSPFDQPEPGQPGGDGDSGSPGSSCSDALGFLSNSRWVAGGASPGSAGRAGSGGGGGGSGGGVEMAWFSGDCEWPDGLAGAGGGGGAGGCGGAGGSAGQSGGAAVGVLVRAFTPSQLPRLQGLEIITENGARGGDGGNGGDGGEGGSGGFGGEVPDEERTTPPLAGPLPGKRGGKGGNGGAGGGGGAGCGGSSIGLWISGLGERPELHARYRDDNQFELGLGGAPGRGGGGAVPAAGGAPGRMIDVLTR